MSHHPFLGHPPLHFFTSAPAARLWLQHMPCTAKSAGSCIINHTPLPRAAPRCPADAECCVSVIVLLLSRLEKDAQLTELARRLALEIGKNAEQMGEVRLNGLLALYGACVTGPARYMVLLHTLEFAKQNKQLAGQLAPVVRVRAHALRVCMCYMCGYQQQMCCPCANALCDTLAQLLNNT
jgi:hypothetical protein